MNICLIHGYYDSDLFSRGGLSGKDLLTTYSLTYHLPLHLKQLGHKVTVLLHFYQNEMIEDNSVIFEFMSPPFFFANVGKLAGFFFHQYRYPYFQLASKMIKRLNALQPQIIHYFGLTMTPNLWLISRWAHKNRVPVIVHYHGGSPAHNLIARKFERKNLQRLSSVLFTTLEQSKPWCEEGLDSRKVRLVVESSTNFQKIDKIQARKQSGLQGDPIFISIGRLHPIKNPLVTLRGFEQIAEVWPNARLYFYYRSTELLESLKEEVQSKPTLAQKVTFCGEVSHAKMEITLNSADFLLQASHAEFSGYALLEAMACGTIPVVSDIAPFRVITEKGRYGILFPRGNYSALAEKVLDIHRNGIPDLSKTIRDKFIRDLSFSSLAKNVEKVYRELVTE